jgi:methylmalonyl-CoA mutase
VTETLTLAGDFPAPTREQWLAEVGRVLLKGTPGASEEDLQRAFDKRLVSRTDDGIAIQPLYTSDDAPGALPVPGQAPFVRSTHAAPLAWEVRQRVWPSVAGSSGVVELESGTTGLLVTVDSSTADVAGLIDRALDGVLLDLAPVSLAVADPADQVPAARHLLGCWEASGTPADERRGCLGLDPLGAWARSGGSFDLAESTDAVAEVVRETSTTSPGVRPVLVDATVWHDAGATEAQELAWAVASGVWTLRALVERGIPLESAARAVEFRFAATDDQFLTIAKLRSARRLWARVLEVAGAAEADRAMVMQAETSRAMLTRYDIWVNALRSTVACFAAGVGGADAVTVLPHDVLVEEGGSSLGRRVARNTQTILQMESHLSRVVDMAGGSWFVESLTEELASHAWSIVQQLEASGGIVASLEGGSLQAAAEQARVARQQQVAQRRRPITGVSEFPDIDEKPPIAPRSSASSTGARFAPMAPHRLSEEFEAQRARADAQARSGDRPVVYLATLGTPAQSTARVTFAKNLFEAAGIRTVAGSVEEFDGTGVVCLCSSDAVYADSGAEAVSRLRAAGAQRVYLAGRGADVPGVDEEVGLGSDVLDVLTRALDALGVER